jgi:tetratricopeptide (TPR) repeat protein
MSRRSTPHLSTSNGTGLTGDLLDRMGLTGGASQEDIERSHDAIVEFLQRAPRDLRGWAGREIVAVDEAYLLLSDPAADLDGPDPDRPDPDRPDPDRPDPDERASDLAEEDTSTEDAADGGPAAATTGPHPGPHPGRTPRRDRTRTPAPAGTARGLTRSRPLRVGLVGAVLVAVVVGVYAMGRDSGVPGISGTPTDKATAATTATPVDQAKVATLMAKISTNPKDVASLRTLGDIYFQAADYATASTWQQKILAIDAKDVTAHLALGAAQFNLGNASEAEKQWKQVVAIDPRQAEAHYDLGFLYLSQSPPDLAKVRAEWRTVVDIDPKSEIAKTVATHLSSLDGATPGASPTASPSASPTPGH